MQAFVHGRLQQLTDLMRESSHLLDRFNRLDLDVHHALSDWLQTAAQVYRSLQRLSTENQMLALKAQMVAAHQGVNPRSLEPVSGQRRANLRATVLGVLQQCTAQLRSDVEQDESLLAHATDQLRPIVLVALGKGHLLQTDASSMPRLEAAWRLCLQDDELRAACQQVALRVSRQDLLLLLGDLLTNLG